VATLSYSPKVSKLFIKKKALKTNHKDAPTAENQGKLKTTVAAEISEDNSEHKGY
jgi:hypothetical protein